MWGEGKWWGCAICLLGATFIKTAQEEKGRLRVKFTHIPLCNVLSTIPGIIVDIRLRIRLYKERSLHQCHDYSSEINRPPSAVSWRILEMQISGVPLKTF